MVYRDGLAADWPQIEKFINSIEYFGHIDCATLGGHWMIAEHKGNIVGTFWCFREGPHAYVDYYAGRGKAAATIGLLAERLLFRAGVRYVRGMVRSDNESALRLVTEGMGMAVADRYHLVYKEIKNGTAENDHNAECTASGQAGERHSAPAPAASE